MTLRLLEIAQRFDNLRYVVGYFDIAEDLRDLSIDTYDKRRALDTHEGLAVHRLFLPDAIKLDDDLIFIDNEWKSELELCFELLMRFFGVWANTDDYSALRLDRAHVCLEFASLFCAT